MCAYYRYGVICLYNQVNNFYHGAGRQNPLTNTNCEIHQGQAAQSHGLIRRAVIKWCLNWAAWTLETVSQY